MRAWPGQQGRRAQGPAAVRVQAQREAVGANGPIHMAYLHRVRLAVVLRPCGAFARTCHAFSRKPGFAFDADPDAPCCLPLPAALGMYGRGGIGEPGAVALVGGLAGFGRRVEEAAELASVVDLHQAAVFDLWSQGFAGEEVGVDAVGADPEQARGKRARTGGDQADAGAELLKKAGLSGWQLPVPCGSHS